MQLVRLIYNSTEVTLSSFILLFLRMVGIITYERYTNERADNLLEVLNQIRKETDPIQAVADEQIDLTIHLLESRSEWDELQPKGSRTVYVAKEDWICEIENSENYSVVYWNNDELYSSLTYLLDGMIAVQAISQSEREILGELAEVFCEKEIFSLFFSTKYFFAAENEDDYKLIEDRYQDIINRLLAFLLKRDTAWGDTDSLYGQHALLYIIYEANFYSHRSHKPFLYTVESLIHSCDEIIRNEKAMEYLGTSMSLLLAQIYDDLDHNLNKSFANYINACRNYCSYAYYRKACQYVNRQDYKIDKAISYFAKAIEIYPWFYRAWHMLGICFSKKKEWDKAILAFEQVNTILANRKNINKVRLVEIEYSFRAANQIGQIYLTKLNDMSRAFFAFKSAEEVWKLIDTSCFTKFVWTNPIECAKIVERMKRELNIERINSSISMIIQQNKDMKSRMDKKGKTDE